MYNHLASSFTHRCMRRSGFQRGKSRCHQTDSDLCCLFHNLRIEGGVLFVPASPVGS